MNELPWSRTGLHGYLEGDATQELQTDVMRFMAILALCLVAVFALVQSLPLHPQPAPELPASERVIEPVTPVRPPRVEPPVGEPVPSVTELRLREAPALQAPRVPEPAPRSMRVEPSPPIALPEVAPEARAEPPIASAEPEGFTLRFLSDAVLTALVEARRVGVYALSAEGSWVLWVRHAALGFRPGEAPATWHLMRQGSVPDSVRAAFERDSGVSGGQELRWGVTLPADIRAQIDQIIASRRGGELVIGPGGDVALGTEAGT